MSLWSSCFFGLACLCLSQQVRAILPEGSQYTLLGLFTPRSNQSQDLVRVHLHPVTVTCLRRRCDITSKWVAKQFPSDSKISRSYSHKHWFGSDVAVAGYKWALIWDLVFGGFVRKEINTILNSFCFTMCDAIQHPGGFIVCKYMPKVSILTTNSKTT